jgi:hypothetical protein
MRRELAATPAAWAEMAPADQARAAITSCHGCSFSQSRTPEGGGITIITRNIKLKKLLLFSALLCVLCGSVFAQNLTTVSASNITDINGSKLAAGQLCFLITDQSDNPISVSIGGGGQALKRGYCGAVAAGVVTPTFTVPNPSATSPSGIYYRVTVKDSSTGQEVLRYTLVSFTGATFNFDNYAPTNLAQGAPLSGTVVSGNLSSNGNATFTGTVTGSNIPSSILQQIFSSGVGQTQRTAFNMMAGLTCSDNAGTSRTDCRLGTLTTVTFSATPTFDASTASTFKLTLTGNVTSSTLSNAVAGEPINIEICQDATGGRTFVPPTNVTGWVTIPSGANACIMQDLVYDGTNAIASSAGTVEFASPPPIGSITPNTGAFTTLSATGTSTLANVTVGTANTLSVNTIKQQAGTAFSLADPLGVTHVFISSSSPYTNTFINGNGGGVVFLGSAAKTSVADTTGIITMSGATSGTTSITPSAIASGTLTLPAATDTLIGKATTDTLTNKTLTSPIISTGVSQGSGFKHQRFGATCTTGATAGNTCTTVLTWTSAFADANYTVTCWGSTPTGTLPVMAENAAHTASAVTIVLQTEFNIASSYGAVDCIAIHD